MQLTSAGAITSAQHYRLHHWASKRHRFSEVYNNTTRGRVDTFMIDIKISPHTFHNKSHTLRWQLIKEQHNFFKHLIISYFTHLVVIWNMPSKQPHQLVFNCTWEDQWMTVRGKLSSFLMLIRLLLIYVSGRAASLLQSHFNDSLTVGGRHCRKPNHSKNQFIPTRSHGEEPHCSFIDEYCLHSLAPFSSLTYDSIFFPSPIFSKFLSDSVKALAIEVLGGSRCLTKGGFSCINGDM